ncbi:MAG: AAA family ATPase, partial [Pedobacter sp.]|nr:AAA family ATPase [Pedobacter sp.]
MELLFENYQKKLQFTPTNFVRSAIDVINWDARLIGIRGARGIG